MMSLLSSTMIISMMINIYKYISCVFLYISNMIYLYHDIHTRMKMIVATLTILYSCMTDNDYIYIYIYIYTCVHL